MDTPSPVEGLDRRILTPVVRQILGSDGVEIVDWQAQGLHGGSWTALYGGGVTRVSGHARLRGEARPWSVVLKVVAPSGIPTADDPTSYLYWQRELLAYQSGLLADLPGSFRAPAFYGGGATEDRRTWLWLEDVPDEAGRDWPDEQYARAARHLGQFSGAYLVGRPLPNLPWLSRNQIRERIEGSVRPAVPGFPAIKDHPDVRRLLPGDHSEQLLRLWVEHDRWLAALDRLPLTLCHMDVVRRNLLGRRGADGEWQTVAIDWAFAGLAGVGQDLATLVAGGLFFCELGLERARRLDKITFEGYLAGLRDAGWVGDARLVRFGCAAAQALWYGLMYLRLARMIASSGQAFRASMERTMGLPFGEVVGFWGDGVSFILDLIDEARELLPLVT